ncbi:MAG: metal ABC transporter permease, partial [Planctomycetota bacterium]
FKTACISSAVAVVHIVLRRPFFAISASPDEARRRGIPIRLMDFVFYVTFGVVVTSSVQMVGVLLVFSYLVIPAVCAMMFFRSIAGRLCAGWCFGVLASVGGLLASVEWDFPTGASIVGVFGVLFSLCSLACWIAGSPWIPATRETQTTSPTG